MKDIRIDKFIGVCDRLESQMTVKYMAVTPSLEFSNTGRRGGHKYFSVTLVQLRQALVDMAANIDEFLFQPEYEEAAWRALFSSHISDEVVNALSTVQTLPLYAVINKILTVANDLNSYDDKSMPLTRINLERAIEYLGSQLPDDNEYLLSLGPSKYSGVGEPLLPSPTLKKSIGGAKNVIFYGAPGTGKSHSIAQDVGGESAIRTVFHPDTQYSDFVGCLKPVMDNGSVGYGFRAGPFTEAIIRAVSQPDKMHYLIVEEINRAPAAAVFGETFQLLDRGSDGSSTYLIDISDPDMLSYMNKSTDMAFREGQMKIPSNLSLLATMNSSDQAVMPLDTAFKRRWEFRYLPIDYTKASKGLLKIPVTGGGFINIEWSGFAQVINERLAIQRIPEDRLLGHRFVSDAELSEGAVSTLKGKIFMYLWDDVLRHGRQGIIFSHASGSEAPATFGQLVKAFEEGEPVFNEDVEAELIKFDVANTNGDAGAEESE